MREDKKQHLLLIPPLLHALPLSRPLEFSLFCFMIAALKGRTMVRLKLQTECQGGKDSIPRRSLNSPWNCGHNGTLARTCLFFFKESFKGILVPKEIRTFREKLPKAGAGSRGVKFPHSRHLCPRLPFSSPVLCSSAAFPPSLYPPIHFNWLRVRLSGL